MKKESKQGKALRKASLIALNEVSNCKQALSLARKAGEKLIDIVQLERELKLAFRKAEIARTESIFFDCPIFKSYGKGK